MKRPEVRTSGGPEVLWRGVAALGVIIFALSACGERQQNVNEQRSWIVRRDDVPFGETRPAPDAQVVAQANRVDALEKLFADGRDGECRTQLAQFFADGGDHPRAHDLHGRLLVLEGRYADAAEAFARAVAGSPRWLPPRLAQAECYLELKRPGAAASVYAELDRLMPEAPWGPWGMGAIATEAPWGPWGMGAIAAMGNDRERAIALLDEALRRDPDHVPSLRSRASLANMMGDAAREESLLLRAAGHDPDHAPTWLRLGALAESDNRLRDAESHLMRAHALTRDPRLAKRIAQLADRRGDPAAAARWRVHARP